MVGLKGRAAADPERMDMVLKKEQRTDTLLKHGAEDAGGYCCHTLRSRCDNPYSVIPSRTTAFAQGEP